MSKAEIAERQYLRERELVKRNLADPVFKVWQYDEISYAVFADPFEAMEFDVQFPHYFRGLEYIDELPHGFVGFKLGRLH